MPTRRTVLKTLAAGGGLAALPGALRTAFGAAAPDVSLRLVAAPALLSIRRGPGTPGLRYTGEVLSGRADALRPSDGTLGPTLELIRGERVRIEVVNDLSEPTVVHWHGLIVPDSADGQPRHAVAGGQRYTVEFTVRNPGGTYLYHPHPHGSTGRQTYYGLSGLLVVRDPAERDRGLPAREHELVLGLQDRRIAADNQLFFKGAMMDEMNGVLGDTVLVNGRADAAFTVAPRPYRLRIANLSNARIYKLAWSDDQPVKVIASDSGLFSRAEGVQERPYVTLFPFQRVELLENFGARRSGAEIALVSREFAPIASMMGPMMGGMGGRAIGMGGMRGGMMSMMGGGDQGRALEIARFTVSPGRQPEAETLVLPEPEPQVPRGRHEIRTQLSFGMMRGFLNGRSFDLTAVADDEYLPVDEASVWTFTNDGPGMAMPHPMHIHGVRFRMLERNGAVPADLRDGVVDTGFRDVVGVFAGEQVRVEVAPTVAGQFMYHCHNLEHEDGGMMRNVVFGSGGGALGEHA